MDIKVQYAPHFESFLKSKSRYQFLFGGRGSSKSHHIAMKTLLRLLSPDYCHILYTNKIAQHIKSQQFADLKKVAKQMNIYDQFRFYENDYTIICLPTGNKATPFGLNDEQRSKGISDVSIVIADELSKYNKEDFVALNNLLRTPLTDTLEFWVAFNPISEKHWIRHFFFDENNPYKLNEYFAKQSYLNHSTFRDNPFIDRKAYYESLKISSLGDQAQLDIDSNGLWGNIKKTGLFIHNFIFDKHTSPNVELQNGWINISIDFNVNPLCALVFQRDVHFRYINVIEEIRLENSDVYELCENILKKYPPNRLLLFGDAAGWSRSYATVGHQSSWDIIKKQLRINDSQIKVPRGKWNGYVSDKRNITNAIMSQHPNFKISSKCPYLIEDLQSVQADDKGGMLKGKDASKSHLLDCLCDYLITDCKDWTKWVKL
jgi:phage terminase large subunit